MKLLLCMIMSLMISEPQADTLSRKIGAFVDKAEMECNSYSAEDWKKSYAEYKVLIQEYSKSETKISDEDRETVNKAKGRYHALLIKHGFDEGKSFIIETGKSIPEYFKGLAGGLGIKTD